ncbi:MAG TPA: hypothetical protein VLW55_13110 [Burkholderiaceae bacterium]|nr:hypothetical protein [Burkholderiaceae bacterium]
MRYPIRIAPLVAALALAACSTADPSPDASNAVPSDPNDIGYPTVDAALAAVRARPGIEESQRDGWTVIEDTAHRETWLFSQPGQPTHPAVVKRTVIKKFGNSTTQTAAMCTSSQDECDKLVAQLNASGGNTNPQYQAPTQSTSPGGMRGGRY